MTRTSFNRFLALTGVGIAALLLVVGGLLTWASHFANSQVSSQLAAQRITMPSGKAIEDPKIKPHLEKYAGTTMDSGDKAKAFADHYIQVHLDTAAKGKTYNEVSGEFMAASKDPARADTEETKKLGELRQTLFMGDTLRSMLLTAYAFGTMGKIAQIASYVCFAGAAVMFLLSTLGLRRARAAGDAAA
ncbi:hypothetical protein [Austwickia chelonae]|uniref:hypothetical protein n=1 Tax=Austwickia chelonae TaxID=100225 RepID=UPI000E2301E5|nr:hypothetical protein [Austwickia chelonae]